MKEPAGTLGLLERGAQLQGLGDLLAAARAGRGGILVLEGAPGIGKTRLLAAARRRADAEAMQVLSATAAEIERSVPFGAAQQLLGPPVRAAEASEREALLGGAAALAAPVLRVGAPEAHEAAAALPLYHGLYWLTANLAERAPLLLCVDDAHWADRSSLGFLLYLAQRLEELRVAVVVAVRDGEPDAPVDLLARLTGHRLARVFRLQPLSPPATEALIRARAPGADSRFCGACHEATGGNPFLALSLLEELQAEGVALTDAAARRVADFAPESVLGSIVARVARLPEPARALADAVAILGADATLRHAAALAQLELADAADASDALVAAGIMVTERTAPAFAHPLLRTGVYREIPEARRALTHRHAAQLLDAAGAPPERVATHLLAAPPRRDADTVRLLRAAARAAVADGEPATAARHLRRALAEPPPDDERLELLLELGRAEALSGGPEAAQRFAAAAELADHPVRRARIRLELGRTLYANGRLAEAAQTFEQGRRDVAGADPELDADLRAGWATVARLDPELRPVTFSYLRDLLMRGDDVATHGERVLLAHAAEQLVFAGEDREQAVALALRALSGNRLLEEETSDGMIWFLTVGDLGWCDEFDEQDRHIEAGFEDARRRGSVWGFANASYLRAFGSFYRGRLAESIADLEQALDAARYGWEQFLPAVHMQLAWSLMERGELDAAERTLARVDGDPRWSQTIMQALVTGARGRLAWTRGRPAEALRDILAAGRMGVDAKMDNPAMMAPWRSWAALAAAQLGESTQAMELVEEELDIARRFGAPRPIGIALRAAGIVAGGRAGIARLEESVSVLERSPAALELARALVDLGQLLRRGGRPEAAREPLRRGLDMAHRFGATVLEAQAHGELRATGARPRRPLLTGVDALTPQERRVAALAARGATNREIAESLFVTRKTVEAHLGSTYRKLELKTRDQLGAALGA